MDHREAQEHVKYQIVNTRVNDYPFPHFYISDVFPRDYYSQIVNNWPGADRFTSIADTERTSGHSYRERHIVNLPNLHKEPSWRGKEFWQLFSKWFLGDDFLTFLVAHYMPWIKDNRALPEEIEVLSDGLLVQDHDGYGIGPHTDAPHRLISTLFYCPKQTVMRIWELLFICLQVSWSKCRFLQNIMGESCLQKSILHHMCLTVCSALSLVQIHFMELIK
jgi:hypothetical protein